MNQTTLIYLDQNKWIDLARAYHNRPGGKRYSKVLQEVKAAVSEGRAIFPLSDSHLIETRKEVNDSRRKRLAQVMVEISQGWIIAPNTYLCPKELEVTIAKLLDRGKIARPKALGRGVAFAFGRSEELQSDLGISDERTRLLEAAIDTPAGLAAFLVGFDQAFTSSGISEFKRRAVAYAQRVEEARSLGKSYSKSIRKRAYVANLTYYLQPELVRILALYKQTFDDFLDLGKKQLLAFFEEVPTLNVEIELATERDEHWDKEVDPNDMTDISFLSAAIPYCDIVITEKFWGNLIKRKKLDEKYDTVILSDLLELGSYLL